MSGKIGASNKNKSIEWYTPRWIFDELAIDFDLDPCSPYDMLTPVPARRKLTLYDDGLMHEWSGKVWLNPPYCKQTPIWMKKMENHHNGIALVFSRTDSKWFQSCLQSASATLFLAGRIKFVPGTENQHKKSTAGAGSAFFAWGDDCKSALKNLAHRGFFICR